MVKLQRLPPERSRMSAESWAAMPSVSRSYTFIRLVLTASPSTLHLGSPGGDWAVSRADVSC